jgi:class 3 adenylate cyclase
MVSPTRDLRLNVKKEKRTLLVFDLSRFSDICSELEQQLDVLAVSALRDQLRSIADATFADIQVNPSEVDFKDTGDGRIIAFKSVKDAHLFAESLHHKAASHNLTRSYPLAQRHFRVGIHAGEVAISAPESRDLDGHGQDFCGTVVANAVRLVDKKACMTGQVLIESHSWAALPEELRRLYGPEECVAGKREETFLVHRRKVIEPAPWDQIPTPVAKKQGPRSSKCISQKVPRKGANQRPNPSAGAAAPAGELLVKYQTLLKHLELQAAEFGIHCPAYVRMEISKLKEIINDWA